PVGDLLGALRQLGADAVSEPQSGCPPVVVRANGLDGGRVSFRGDVSSQFLSALLMAAPFARGPVDIDIDGPLVSQPYVQMTVKMMKEFGVGVVLKDFPQADGQAIGGFRILGPGERQTDPGPMIAAAAFHEGFDPRRHMLLR